MKYKRTAVLLIAFLVLGCIGSDETREVKDCGSDEECMMDAMITCEPAKCTLQYEEIDFLGSVETLSKEGDDCKYALNIETPKKARFTCIHKDGDSEDLGNDVCSNKKTVADTMKELMSDIEMSYIEMPEKQAVDPEPLSMEQYRMYCDSLCEEYIDADFDPREALEYCEKYFEIDLNRNGEITGEAAKINAFGVCENRVYCLNIRGCNWGSSKNSRLSPEKCRDIMCDVYTERYRDADMASVYIAKKMKFGSCYLYDPLISFEDVDGKMISIAQWWIDNFKDVNCSGE